jgi:glucosamine--fructose-6-phosphate aminotransferase (isomerizing)
MCGISAITGHGDVVKMLFESIKSLEYRGYDSCGLAVLNGGEIAVRKNTGGVDEVNAKEHLTNMVGTTGVAHTRWATHGGVTQANAHPHSTADGSFSIVHNGIVNNYLELRDELAAKGVKFLSETDTEVIVHLIGMAYAEFGDVEAAFIAALKRLVGTFGLVMVTRHAPGTLYCARQGSPLVLGLSDRGNFVSSDVNAFLGYTRDAVVLEDGEFAVVTPDAHRIARLKDLTPVTRKPLRIQWDPETSRKGGYSHFMLKEIFDQPQTVNNALSAAQAHIDRLADTLLTSRQTYLMGVGTTHYVALVGQYLISRLAHRYVAAVSSDEFLELAIVGPGDLVVSISQSGETYDTRRAAGHAKTQGAITASIVNVMGSSLSLSTDQVILQGSGPEICVVSTKAALAQMIVLHRVALALGLRTGKLDRAQHDAHYEALRAFPALVQSVLNEQSGFVRNLAERTVHFRNWLLLGRGIYQAIAQEAALKLKEVTYLHAEGIPAGFLKHGTLAMVDEALACLFFIPPPSVGDLHEETLHAIQEVKARGGPVYGLYFEDDTRAPKILNDGLRLPTVPAPVAPYLELIVAQLFAYFSALKLGRSIDKPRNLAKSVTVP